VTPSIESWMWPAARRRAGCSFAARPGGRGHPEGYAKKQARGKPALIQILVDGGDSNRAIVAQNAIITFAMQRAARQLQDSLLQLAAARARPRFAHRHRSSHASCTTPR